MKKNLILTSLLFAAFSLSMVSCDIFGASGKRVRSDYVMPYTMIHYYDFGGEQPDYLQKTAYDTFRLTGHDVVSFDEEAIIAKTIHEEFGINYNRIKANELVKTERCITVECCNFGFPMTYMGDVIFYENGHIYVNEKWYGEGEFYYTMSQENANLLFKVVEEDIVKIEQGKRNYYEDAKSLCTLESYYAYADSQVAREYCGLRGEITLPYSVSTDLFGNGTFYDKERINPIYNKIKEVNYTFKGYRSVDYDALKYSLLYLGCDYYNTYGFILEGGCNFSIAGIAMIYGDYKDGKYHSLIAEYSIDSKDGEAIYDTARSFFGGLY